MRKSKFTEEQIAFALRQAGNGEKVEEVCRKLGVAEQTFYRWKKKYGGLGVNELLRLQQLEEENKQLKKLVPDLSLDKQMLQEVLRKKFLGPPGSGPWWNASWRTCASVRGTPVQWSSWRARPTTTGHASVTIHCCGCGSVRLRLHGSGMDTNGFTHSFVVKAWSSITRRCTGCIARTGSICDGSFRDECLHVH